MTRYIADGKAVANQTVTVRSHCLARVPSTVKGPAGDAPPVPEVKPDWSPVTDHPALGDAPPSTKYVCYVLWEDGPLTQAQIVGQTGLPPRTTRWALNRLRDADALRIEPHLGDLRKKQYDLDVDPGA